MGSLSREKIDEMFASGPSHKGGLVPDPGPVAGTSKYLREDGTWSEPAGGGGGGATTLTGAVTGTGTGTFATSYGDVEVAALASVISAADKLFYFTGSGTGAVADLPAQARTFLASSTVLAQTRALLPIYTITPAAGAASWTPATQGLNATITLAQAAAVSSTVTLAIPTTTLVVGDVIRLLVLQDATGFIELIFPSTCKLTPGPKLEASASTAYELTFDGTNFTVSNLPHGGAFRQKIYSTSGGTYVHVKEDHCTDIFFTGAAMPSMTWLDRTTNVGVETGVVAVGNTVRVNMQGADTLRGIKSGTTFTTFDVIQDAFQRIKNGPTYVWRA